MRLYSYTKRHKLVQSLQTYIGGRGLLRLLIRISPLLQVVTLPSDSRALRMQIESSHSGNEFLPLDPIVAVQTHARRADSFSPVRIRDDLEHWPARQRSQMSNGSLEIELHGGESHGEE